LSRFITEHCLRQAQAAEGGKGSGSGRRENSTRWLSSSKPKALAFDRLRQRKKGKAQAVEG